MPLTELHPPYRFPCRFPPRSRLTSSRPGAILVTPSMPNPMFLLLTPAHSMCYVADSGPHTGPQLNA
eukprot:801690-Pelagomonas_calceolata.AAC.2